MTRQVVLVGAGHAHMEALRQSQRFANAGLSLTLIDPGAFWYSGAATGVLSGALAPDAARLNPAEMAGPFLHVRQRVRAVEPKTKTLRLEDGLELSYDVLSLAVVCAWRWLARAPPGSRSPCRWPVCSAGWARSRK